MVAEAWTKIRPIISLERDLKDAASLKIITIMMIATSQTLHKLLKAEARTVNIIAACEAKECVHVAAEAAEEISVSLRCAVVTTSTWIDQQETTTVHQMTILVKAVVLDATTTTHKVLDTAEEAV